MPVICGARRSNCLLLTTPVLFADHHKQLPGKTSMPGACPRIEDLLRKRLFGRIFRPFCSAHPCASPLRGLREKLIQSIFSLKSAAIRLKCTENLTQNCAPSLRPLFSYRLQGLSPTCVSLVPHTKNQTLAVRSIKAEINMTSDGALRLRYSLEGELDQLAIPAMAPPVHTDGLWRHTCFEAFVAAGNSSEYCEFNFSPSTQWAAYGFARYRQEMLPLQCGACMPVEVCHSNERLELEASITSMALRTLAGDGEIRIALAVVVEEKDGRLSYWALVHPSSSPDFHHPDSFILHLQRPVAGAAFTNTKAPS